MDDAPTIHQGLWRVTAHIAQGPGSSLVERFLTQLVGPEVCLLKVQRQLKRYTIVLDPGWVEVGVAYRDTSSAVAAAADLGDMELPRDAMCAVIHDWPGYWDDAPAAFLSLIYSPDGIPHISVSGSPLQFANPLV